MNWRHGEFDFGSEQNPGRHVLFGSGGRATGGGLGDDVDGYWKIERVFEMIEPRVELHEDKFPVSHALALEQFRALMVKREECWV